MDDPEAVTRYLFNQRADLLTEDEKQAASVDLWQEKASASGGALWAKLQSWADAKRTPATDALLREGSAAFRARVRDRIIAQHGDSIFNRCPRCNGLCNTPRARQCPHCFYDWH